MLEAVSYICHGSFTLIMEQLATHLLDYLCICCALLAGEVVSWSLDLPYQVGYVFLLS